MLINKLYIDTDKIAIFSNYFIQNTGTIFAEWLLQS